MSPGSGRDRQAPQGTGRLEAYLHMHHPDLLQDWQCVSVHDIESGRHSKINQSGTTGEAVACAISRPAFCSQAVQACGFTPSSFTEWGGH